MQLLTHLLEMHFCQFYLGNCNIFSKLFFFYLAKDMFLMFVNVLVHTHLCNEKYTLCSTFMVL